MVMGTMVMGTMVMGTMVMGTMVMRSAVIAHHFARHAHLDSHNSPPTWAQRPPGGIPAVVHSWVPIVSTPDPQPVGMASATPPQSLVGLLGLALRRPTGQEEILAVHAFLCFPCDYKWLSVLAR